MSTESAPLTAEEMDALDFIHCTTPDDAEAILTSGELRRLLSMARAGIAAQTITATPSTAVDTSVEAVERLVASMERDLKRRGPPELTGVTDIDADEAIDLLRALRSELTAAQARAERAREEAIRECGAAVDAEEAEWLAETGIGSIRERLAMRCAKKRILALLDPGAARNGE